ncbi:AT-hook motif nuclear-localized protein 14 [Mangifera indica]|uniref:AT-hook motif nuclear-localized protein 14 n=1 Tax=Mangifera indica TaxID=29780 RepID=UPI001CF99303|nr:AT-hook motif nuclear-localized protein 14 [Mangifera indica]
MEPNDTQQLPLSSYFHHHHHQHHHHSATAPSATAATASPTNGLLPPPPHTTNDDGAGSHHHQQQHNPMVYPHSVGSSAVTSPLEPAKRKRGRPRKYGTPEQALAAKKTASASASNSKEKREALLGCNSSSFGKKSQLVGFGNSGQGFTPHVISVAAGEDVSQKIMMFMQQSKHEVCILSASGSISNTSLRQPATSGGNITYEGRFEIISLSGSYVRTEIGGRTGGLSVCLSSSDGQIIGGGVGGPLKAAGPVQVIVATFQIDTKKDANAGLKGDASGSKLPSPVGGASVSSIGFRSPIESSGRNPIRGNEDFQTIGGSHFMIQPSGMHVSPSRTEWRSSLDARTSAGYDLTGRAGRGAHQSPENGDYDQIPD